MARQLRDAQCHTIWEGTENICCLDVRRAIRGEDADQALLARVERAVAAAVPIDGLADVTTLVAAGVADARAAISHLATAADDLQLLHARRLTGLLTDVVQGALLLEEATWAIGRDGDGRKAVVARSFCRNHLGQPAVRGILDDDRTAIDLYEPITRYERIAL